MRVFMIAALFASLAGAAYGSEPRQSRLEAAFFGGGSWSSADLSRVPFWADVVTREAADEQKAGFEVRAEAMAEADVMDSLQSVNAAINTARYVSDRENFNQSDRWQTPAELAARGGDCEDFAAAKYFALRRIGLPASSMRVALVVDEATRMRHAVLMVSLPQGRVVVLDNLYDEVVPASALANYRPLMAMNEGGWQLASAELRAAPTAPAPLMLAEVRPAAPVAVTSAAPVPAVSSAPALRSHFGAGFAFLRTPFFEH